MRENKRQLIVAFQDTHTAIAFEKLCRQKGVPGRMIPLPSQISAGCGLAWTTEPQNRSLMGELLDQAGMEAIMQEINYPTKK